MVLLLVHWVAGDWAKYNRGSRKYYPLLQIPSVPSYSADSILRMVVPTQHICDADMRRKDKACEKKKALSLGINWIVNILPKAHDCFKHSHISLAFIVLA